MDDNIEYLQTEIFNVLYIYNAVTCIASYTYIPSSYTSHAPTSIYIAICMFYLGNTFKTPSVLCSRGDHSASNCDISTLYYTLHFIQLTTFSQESIGPDDNSLAWVRLTRQTKAIHVFIILLCCMVVHLLLVAIIISGSSKRRPEKWLHCQVSFQCLLVDFNNPIPCRRIAHL